jgi:ATP-binding cassette subfamily B multidrug efflux pump
MAYFCGKLPILQIFILTDSTTKNKGDWATFKRLMRQTLPYKNIFFGSLGMAIFLAVLSPLRPLIIQIIIDKNILNYDIKGLTGMSLLLIAVLIIETLFRYLFGYATSILGHSVIKDLRVKVFNHITSLRLQYFDKTPIGYTVSRTINDVEAINKTFSEGIITIFSDLLTLIIVVIFMFAINWKITLICLTTFPLLIISTYIFKEKIKSSFLTIREKISQMNVFLQEHISGMRIIQIFNAEEREMKKFQTINKDLRDANLKSVMYYSVFFPVVEIILALAIALLIWYGSNQVLKDFASVGIFTSFLLYLNMAFRPLRMLADNFNTLQMGIVASQRVFSILDTKTHIQDNGTIKNIPLKGEVDFNQVYFAYNDADYVLKNISFSVKEGETVALVGATGSGKTSTINILSRFYEINQGSIKIDNIDIKEFDLDFLRSRIAVVLQDVFLFSGTIYDNITLNNSDIKLETVIEAAKLVGAHSFISNLPDQYQYKVRERGATLSVGQRQLISFIRALVYNPTILVLDEATSSVDTESELLIQNAIEKLVEGRTSIIIAHRLSTIQHADKIIVLDKGEIKEMGNHATLIQKEGGWYKKLHDMQFQKKELIPAK